mmetsp:Transcript_10232/g.28772  ORF Transcript_10232/g.28772 Transcript_10232/m.28772 type:complete len:385 (+) Transcript_10232:66-1220(+)
MNWSKLLLQFIVTCLCLGIESIEGRQLAKAIVLIGPHKTGSTSLQSNLVRNANVLKNNGYALIGSGHAKQASLFATSIMSGSKSKPYYDMVAAIERSRQKASNIILASETMDKFCAANIAALKEILSGFNVTIVAFHRERTAHLRSYWSQLSRTLRSKPSPMQRPYVTKFDDFLPRFLATSFSGECGPGVLPGPRGFDLYNLLQLYSATFGEKAIRLVSFGGALRSSSAFEVFVSQILELPFEMFTEGLQNQNRSPSSFTLNVVHRLEKVGNMAGCTINHAELGNIMAGNVPYNALLDKLPRQCANLTGLKHLFDLDDDKVFNTFGLPLLYSKREEIVESVCDLDCSPRERPLGEKSLHKLFSSFATNCTVSLAPPELFVAAGV